ncbi:hypothetical protein M1146_07740 [Patescibacteria group bacterium]|nr:hypothetical protein [Patescibacteria group bacterium]
MKRIVKYNDYPKLTVHFSTWFPLFSQGVYLGFSTAIVKFVYYKDTKIVSNEETEDVVKHEYSHFISRQKRGWFNFWINILWDYLRFWIKHDSKLMEVEANKIKETLK